MRKKICKISVCLFFAVMVAGPLQAQYLYQDETAGYTVDLQDDAYTVDCRLNIKIGHSAKLQRTYNQLRLKAIDLIGNYVVLNSVDLPVDDRGSLFQAFVDNTSLRFAAEVEKLHSTPWAFCDGERCISFSCAKNDFTVTDRYLEQDFDLGNILYTNFRRRKDLASACALISTTQAGPDLLIPSELLFLNGSAEITPAVSALLKTNPSYRLENSLFSNDSLQQALVDSISMMSADFCPFGKMILSKILFTSANPDAKAAYYADYRYFLSQVGGVWYDMLQFAAAQCENHEPTPMAEATVFDVIGNYPVALNIFGMRQGTNGLHYDQAVEAFAASDPGAALAHLQNEINFNGINATNLNLTGACYRLLENPGKALPYLLLATYLDSEAIYVRGNIALCLQALNYPGIDEVSDYFLEDKSLDPWSKNQIMNLKNP